jgi:RNA polymerase sigma factor (sigma-70 family)
MMLLQSMAQTDAELVRAAHHGDPEAISELLRLHGPVVEQSLRIGENWRPVLDAADVMQITYLEAFMQIRSFDPERATTFRSWLQRIAENNLRDAVRGLERAKRPNPRNRLRAATHEDSLVGLFEELEATSATPSRNLGQREACRILEAAIAALPETYADVIRLYDLEGQPIEDVARSLDRSPGAIHMLRARAHDRLREHLGSSPGIL